MYKWVKDLIHKTYKCRIYPNKKQRELFEKHFGSVRWIFNWGLEEKIKLYNKNKEQISSFDLMKKVVRLKKTEEFKWLKEVGAQSLNESLMNLDFAFKNFFRHGKRFPKFKSKKRSKKTFQITQHTKLANGKLNITKISNIKIKLGREVKGKIKTITISKTPSGKYFVSILVEQNKNLPLKPLVIEETTIGIDLGIKTFATISDGRKIDNPKFLNNSLKKLRKQQKRLSRKVKGSNNRGKQRIKVALCHEKIVNQRTDFLHKLSYQLTHENQIQSIAIENLGVSKMIKNRRLAREISDVGWGEFGRQLKYKCDWYGKNLLTINRFAPSSKSCSCGYVNQDLKLSDRKWTCLQCNTTHDRDLLASQNIKKFALVGRDKSELTLGGEINNGVYSLKQEFSDYKGTL